MVFNSLTFLIFFAGVVFMHSLPLRWTTRKWNLLLASYVFYAAWNPPFVLLLIITAVIDFHLARAIGRSPNERHRKVFLGGSVALNLGLLSYFKYGNFVLANFTVVLQRLGIHYHPAAREIFLPLGISFYTFETISYLVDVYRRRIPPWHSFVDYALFLTFFPHLVAGPIVRAEDFLPQCVKPKRASGRQMGWGLSLMAIGLFEKIILADTFFAPVADAVFGHQGAVGSIDAWLGTLAFSGQIFCDFAGYSTCGIGAALCLGFVLKDNFHFPYAAIGFSDFWRRWHISLSSWLRDYLYIPLGGNRKGAGGAYRNLLLTMLLGGLWHGAAWRFVAWSGLHGSYLVGERLLRRRWSGTLLAANGLVRVLVAALTFLLVCVAWIFFRANDFQSAFQLMHRMIVPTTGGGLVARRELISVLTLTGILLAGQWFLRDSSLEQAVDRFPWWLQCAAMATILLCLIFAPGDDRAFIYFQF